jgi:acyl phosphate:glycerol-3-phosphate acyltransferase
MIALWLALGYLAGSFPTGVLVARLRGVDITHVGSGNIGATNVARALGKKLGAVVLLVDAAKGFAPVWVAVHVLHLDHAVVAGIGALAILGHVFPVWLKFRGGKGVATGLGVFLALDPLAAAVAVVVWVALYAIFRISSLGSMMASTSIPITMAFRHAPRPYLALAAAVLALVLFRHRGNIVRLVRRQETKV